MNFGPRNMQMSSEAMPAMRISPIPTSRALSTRSRPDRARALDQHPVARAGELLEQRPGLLGRRRRSGSRRRSPRRRRSGRVAHGDQHVDAQRRPRARRSRGGSAASLAQLGHRRRAPRSRRSRSGCSARCVERRAHRHRVGVVAVVHDRHPARQLDDLAAQRREARRRPARRARPRAPAPRPPRPAC